MIRSGSLEEDLLHIIRGCLEGKRSAQEQLYRQHYSFAMRIAMRYATDEQEAGAILSHAFVRVFRGLGSFDSNKGNFHGWLKKIVVNEAIDFIRQRSRFSTEVLSDAEEPFISTTVIDQLNAADLLQLVKQLPPATHAVFLLYAVDGYTHQEIAHQLNIKEGTSKWHLSEARRLLQQQLTLHRSIE